MLLLAQKYPTVGARKSIFLASFPQFCWNQESAGCGDALSVAGGATGKDYIQLMSHVSWIRYTLFDYTIGGVRELAKSPNR